MANDVQPPCKLRPGPEETWDRLVHFTPLTHRTVQFDGVTMFHIRYWRPIFVGWDVERNKLIVRYRPEDL